MRGCGVDYFLVEGEDGACAAFEEFTAYCYFAAAREGFDVFGHFVEIDVKAYAEHAFFGYYVLV